MSLTLVGCGGCGGCQRDSADAAKAAKELEKKKKELELRRKKKEKKPDFVIEKMKVLPADGSAPIIKVKPGHWVSAKQEILANNFKFPGDLETRLIDKQGRPVELARTPFRMTSTRPALLPKGQLKHIESTFFVPHSSRAANVLSTLRDRRTGYSIPPSSGLFAAMPAYQYRFVILAREADEYGYIKSLDSVHAPWNDEYDDLPKLHYNVVAPKTTKPVALPSHPLAWTSIAYVLWDDMDAGLLSLEQQRAMLDWLHWGGQLMISGPNSLEELRESFLGPYLPADAGDAREIGYDTLAELNTFWTLREKRRPGPPLVAIQPWSGVTLKAKPGAAPVPKTGGLLIERGVGRGRVVVSAFRLSERDLVNWHGHDGFFNACLLRRPRRRFSDPPYGGVSVDWADQKGHQVDPRLNCNLRYFSRDLGNSIQFAPRRTQQFDQFDQFTGIDERPADPMAAGGVASWNPMSATSKEARSALREAAGIVVPKAQFVVLILAGYLVVLVPMNWLLFSAVGRVEWAWVAAPLIALVCSVVVVRLAQLDIGFARSHTEVAVLELQGDYPRGHLTRYIALYTSLATGYDVHFDDPDRSALVQPFPVDENFKMLTGQRRTTVAYRRYDDVSLTGLRISSNTTGMLHSEQMLDVGGPIRLGTSESGGLRVVNESTLNLREVGVLRRRVADGGSERFEACWLGDVPAGGSMPLAFSGVDDRKEAFEERSRSDTKDWQDRLQLQRLIQLAEDSQHIEAGEIRLVGQVDDAKPLAGARIDPAASQTRAATLVVAHLKHGDRKPPTPDVNTRYDYSTSGRGS